MEEEEIQSPNEDAVETRPDVCQIMHARVSIDNLFPDVIRQRFSILSYAAMVLCVAHVRILAPLDYFWGVLRMQRP